jgi:hypothetical protein
MRDEPATGECCLMRHYHTRQQGKGNGVWAVDDPDEPGILQRLERNDKLPFLAKNGQASTPRTPSARRSWSASPTSTSGARHHAQLNPEGRQTVNCDSWLTFR